MQENDNIEKLLNEAGNNGQAEPDLTKLENDVGSILDRSKNIKPVELPKLKKKPFLATSAFRKLAVTIILLAGGTYVGVFNPDNLRNKTIGLVNKSYIARLESREVFEEYDKIVRDYDIKETDKTLDDINLIIANFEQTQYSASPTLLSKFQEYHDKMRNNVVGYLSRIKKDNTQEYNQLIRRYNSDLDSSELKDIRNRLDDIIKTLQTHQNLMKKYNIGE